MSTNPLQALPFLLLISFLHFHLAIHRPTSTSRHLLTAFHLLTILASLHSNLHPHQPRLQTPLRPRKHPPHPTPYLPPPPRPHPPRSHYPANHNPPLPQPSPAPLSPSALIRSTPSLPTSSTPPSSSSPAPKPNAPHGPPPQRPTYILFEYLPAVLAWDREDEGPPLFGRVADTYSMRRLWGGGGGCFSIGVEIRCRSRGCYRDRRAWAGRGGRRGCLWEARWCMRW